MAVQIDSQFSSSSRPDPIVGIDLGTTHSLIAIVKDGKPQVLNSREGHRLVPSVVSFIEGQPIVGYAAKKRKVRDAEHTIFSAKRLLGRGFEDLNGLAEGLPYSLERSEGLARVCVGDRSYTAIEISAFILKELKLSAEKALGCPVSRAVITVPAYFNDAQRQATRAAGRLAGWDVLRMINEPTAASLAYGLDRRREGVVAVYDLGGGTFDISVLKLQDGIFEVLATQGDTALGGDDIDRAIAQKVAQDVAKTWGIDLFQDAQLHAALLEAAEITKVRFADQSQDGAQVQFELEIKPGQIYQNGWTLEEFEALVQPILERTRKPCLAALKDAGLTLSDLSDVVLVGGPTRLRVVQQWVEKLFGRKPNTSVHPDEVVAEGAAIQADILAGNNQDLLLLDVVPLSLGLETYGGLTSVLIPRNSRIPTVAREIFTTFVDRQTGVDIHVVQGERERVIDNRSLARFKLKGIQPMPAGMPRVEVSFLIDADGILQVSAKDLKTEMVQSIEVKPSFGLTDEEVEKMLLQSQENLSEDVEFRRWVEARNEAEPVLRATENALSCASGQLSTGELQQIRQVVDRLREALKQKSPEQIRQLCLELNQKTVHLAEIIVVESIQLAQKKNSENKTR